MDRHLPPRVTYWTGIWRPGLEAISNELCTVRAALAPRAPIVSYSSGQSTRLLPAERAMRLSGARTWLLKSLMATVERLGDVTHVWGAIDDWHYVRSLGRRPAVFTVVLSGEVRSGTHYAKMRIAAAESEPLAQALVDAGVARDRVRVVYPGVDLQLFSPARPPAGRFRLIFASSPSDPEEFDARGIPLLVDLARACPDLDVVLIWREWGSEDAAAQTLAALDPPPNLIREPKGARTMAEVFRSGHVVTALYAHGFGKSCPNSVVEALACGRPALVSQHCGIASLIADAGAGIAVPRSVDACIDAVRRLERDWARYAACARALADRAFDVETFVAAYREIYRDLAQQPR